MWEQLFSKDGLHLNKRGAAVLGAASLISEISKLSYEECLQQCRLTTLETRRIRGD